VKLAPDLKGGWLAFEGGGERRRLSPVPPDWQRATEAELRRFLATALPVARPARQEE
jgi:hypothetical protein